MLDRPIIFISSVSRELHTTRDLVAKTLYSQGYDPKWEDIANSDPGNLLATIRDWIDQSVGLVQLVGHCYGGQTDIVDPSHGPLSYTQYEAVYARQKALPVWYIILSAKHPTDGCGCQPNTLHDLQSKYRDAVRNYGIRYFPSDTRDQTKIVVLELNDELKSLRAEAEKCHQKLQGDVIEVKQGVSNLERMMIKNTAPGRLAAYKRSLLAAFRPYQELAIDNFAAAEQACPDIWDIFVHPACSEEHLRPEDMDAAQMEKPPRLPATDLLPLMAQDDHRRTVLLADPGMGKSTLIQSLIAHLASGRPLVGAPALSGLLPVPLILRDLVALLPQDQVEGWTWDNLVTVLLERYQREETAPPLCEAYQGHEDEFRQLIHSSTNIFFLIDGLDEIGDLAKRRKIVQCIQEGIRAVSKETRWLITSRVIGFENCPVDYVEIPGREEWLKPDENGQLSPEKWIEYFDYVRETDEKWKPWIELPDKRRLVRTWSFKALEKGENMIAHILSPKNARSAGVEGFLIAQRLYLAPFDNARQDDFTSKWFKKRHSTDHSRELMREVRAHHHDGVRIISRVPNLLCMMNMLKRSGKPLPDGRAALYDEIVKAYLGGIDSAYKFKPILGHTCPFETAERRHLLSLLGAHMQQQRTSAAQPTAAGNKKAGNSEPRTENDSILISVPELQTLLLPAIEAMQQAGKVKSDHFAAELLSELLHHIASRSGLLIPRSTDAEGNTVYGFTHLSFLEFFAAEWLRKEFERLQKRLARRAEALADGLDLTEADLNREFPAPRSIEHKRAEFPLLAATPAWHEPLIFLLESRPSDATTLLRWLFPALHAPTPKPSTLNLKLRSCLSRPSNSPSSLPTTRNWHSPPPPASPGGAPSGPPTSPGRIRHGVERKLSVGPSPRCCWGTRWTARRYSRPSRQSIPSQGAMASSHRLMRPHLHSRRSTSSDAPSSLAAISPSSPGMLDWIPSTCGAALN